MSDGATRGPGGANETSVWVELGTLGGGGGGDETADIRVARNNGRQYQEYNF